MKKNHIVYIIVFWFFASFTVTYSCSTPAPTESTQEQVAQNPEPNPAEQTPEAPGPEPKPEPTPEKPLPEEPSAPDAAEKPEPVAEIAPEPAQELLPETPVTEVIPESTGGPKPGFGKLSGDCGVLDDQEWKSTNPFIFQNIIDFAAMDFDSKKLSPGGLKIFKAGNLGGSSVHSEVFSFEVLYRCEYADLLKTEGEIKYKQSTGKKTDILVRIDGNKVGVSVTRAFKYPIGKAYTATDADKLLKKKLADILLSATNADPKDAWSRSMLHILSYNKQHTDTLKAAYQKIDAKVKDKTILLITTTEGKDIHIYKSN